MGASAATSGTSLVSVGNSALYNTANTEYLSRTPSGAGTSATTWTMSFWVYRSRFGGSNGSSLFGCTPASNTTIQVYFSTSDTLKLHYILSTTDKVVLETTQVFRDIGWYHICVVADTSNAIANERVRFIVNGERVTSFSTETQNSGSGNNIAWNSASTNHVIGAILNTSSVLSWPADSYFAEVVFLDGTASTNGSEFGEYDSSGLYWTPKSSAIIQALTFGTNGFYLANKVTNQPQLDFQAGDDNSLANSQISALLHMDGSNDATSTTDSSSYGNAVTFAGNAHLDTSVKKYGTASLQLDGNGDYVTMADNDLFDFGTGDFTIRFSIYFTTIHSISAAYTNLMMSRITSAGNGFVISYKNGTNLYLMVNGTAIDQAYTLSTGQWYQMEISRESGTCRWFVDGTQRGTGTQTGNADQSEALAIGASAHSGYRASDRDIAGYMDEIEIIKGAAMHDSNFTAPSAAYSDPPTANNWTNNNTVTTVDYHTPTKLGLLINNLFPATATTTYLNGAKDFKTSATSQFTIKRIPTTLTLPDTGKWILGFTLPSVGTSGNGFGLTSAAQFVAGRLGFPGSGVGYPYLGYHSTSSPALWSEAGMISNAMGTGVQAADEYYIAVDLDNTKAYGGFWDNSASTLTWYAADGGTDGNPADGSNPSNTIDYTGGSQFTMSSINNVQMGLIKEDDISITIPTGFSYFNQTNVFAATTRTASDVTKYFQTVLYEGNGAGQRVGAFQPFTDTFTVAKSALFPTSNGNLSKTFGSAGNQKKWTFSAWLKKCANGAYLNVLRTSHGNDTAIQFTDSDKLQFYVYDGSSYLTNLITTDVYKDASQWMHVVLKWDSTPSTPSASSVAIYINGSQVTALDTAVYPSQNVDSGWNGDGAQTIGIEGTNFDWDGYMSEVTFIDGSALEPSSFGQTDTSTNRWIPKAVTGLTYGTNGFYLDFSNGSDLGEDQKNSNDWTNNNSVAQSTDSPTTNWAVLNPNNKASQVVLSIGNTQLGTTVASIYSALCTLPMTTGKYYFEVEDVSSDGTYPVIGVASAAANVTGNNELGDAAVGGIGYRASGAVTQGGSTIQSYASWSSATNVAGCAYDADTGQVWFRASAGWNGDPAAGTGAAGVLSTTAQKSAFFGVSGYTHSTSATPRTIFKEDGWTYSAPTGFVALSQDNMTDTEQFISAFSWIKNRDATDNHMLFDRVRGIYNDWHWNDTALQVTNVETVQRFLSAGVQIGSDAEVNTANESYVLWNWMMEATGSGSSNTDGSINTISTLVDTTLGMSISTYTGDGNTATVGHGLGVTPDFVVTKVIDTSAQGGYGTFPKLMTENYNLYINAAGNQDAGNAYDTSENSSTVVGLTGASNGTNGSGRKYVMYAFATSQFISIGKYINNNNANGPFVPTINSLGIPLQPVWVMAKTLAGASWVIVDNKRIGYNPDNYNLLADTTVVENTADKIDIVTGGFKLRTNLDPNYSTSTTLYMAIGTPIIDVDGRIIAGR